MEIVKDIALLIVPLVTAVLGFYGGRANQKKATIEGVILTADKINELVDKLSKAKEEILTEKSKLFDCLQGQKQCAELKKMIFQANDRIEVSTEEAINILKSLKNFFPIDADNEAITE